MLHNSSKSYLKFSDVSVKKTIKKNLLLICNQYLLRKFEAEEKKKAPTTLQPGKKEETHCSSSYYFADEQGSSHGKTTLIWCGIFAKRYWPRDDRANLQRFSWGNVQQYKTTRLHQLKEIAPMWMDTVRRILRGKRSHSKKDLNAPFPLKLLGVEAFGSISWC